MTTRQIGRRLTRLEERVLPRNDGMFTMEELCRSIWRSNPAHCRELAQESGDSIMRSYIPIFEAEDAKRSHEENGPLQGEQRMEGISGRASEQTRHKRIAGLMLCAWSSLMNLDRRLELLEQQLTSEPIVLLMPDGRTETLWGDVLDLFSRAIRGDRTPEIELIAQSESSKEPGGAHMIDLARALLNGPVEDAPRQPA